MEDIKYNYVVHDRPALPVGDQESKASSAGKEKKRKSANETSGKMNSAKKKKNNDEKAKNAELGSSQRSSGKDSPKKDVSAGMKNLMAQFVKRTPPKSSQGTPKPYSTSK